MHEDQPAEAGRRRTILVVDDEPVMRTFLDVFIGQQYTVVTQDNGATALAWLQDGNRVDLILADLKMPEMNGHVFIEEIRKAPQLNHLPLIILSGTEKSEDRIRCLRLGADDFIVKPFNPEELMARIENVLRRAS